MKKIISLVLIALFVCGVAFAATPGRDAGHDAGDVAGNNSSRYDWDAHKTFRLVRYMPATYSATGATLVTESIVTWDLNSDDGVTVTTSTTSYDSAVAGIIVQQALTPTTTDTGSTAKKDYGRRNWTWLQTYGKCEVRVQGDDAPTAGDALAVGSDAGEACSYFASTSDAGLQGNAGFWYDTGTAAADDTEVFVRCE